MFVRSVLLRLDSDNRAEVSDVFVRQLPAAILSDLARTDAGFDLLLTLLEALGIEEEDLGARLCQLVASTRLRCIPGQGRGR